MATKNVKNDRMYLIHGGPSRATLFDACLYAYDKEAKIPLGFQVSYGTTMPKDHPGAAYCLLDFSMIRLASIAHEDGSGHKFNLYGYCRTKLPGVDAEETDHRFIAFYDAKTREGTMTIFDR